MISKLIRQFIPMSFALLMAVSLVPARVQASAPAVLKKSGTITDQKGEIRISNYIYKKSGDNLVLITPDGTEVKDITAQDIAVDTHNVYKLRKKGTHLTETAVVSKEGKVLIPYAQAVDNYLNDRFWTSTVALKKTKNKEEAMIFGTDNTFALTPDEDDTLYTGKMKIYDVITGKEVPGIEITSPKARIEALDDTLYLIDENRKRTIYDKEGKVLVADAADYSILGGFYSVSKGGMTDILDSSLKKLFSTDKNVRSVSSSSEYLYYVTDSDLPVLMDKTGKEIFKAKKKGMFEEVLSRADVSKDGLKDILVFNDTSGKDYMRSLIKADGTEISKSIYSSISWLGNGYFEGRRKEGEDTVYDIFDEKGTLWGEGLKNYDSSNLCSYKEGSGSDKSYYVFDKKDYALKLAGAGPVGFGLIKAYDDKTASYALFDAFTGTQVLKYEYKNIYGIDNKIYAYKDGEYTIYDVSR